MDAGLNAYGCVFVEVWLMNPDGTALRRVEPGGHWMDPSFAHSLSSEELTRQAMQLNRFARDCPPGVGLAGTLFNSVDGASKKVYWRQIGDLLNDPFVQRNSGHRMQRLHEIGIGLVGSVPFSFQDENGLVCFFSRYNADLTLLRSSMNEGFLIGSTDLIGSQIAIIKNRKECATMRRQIFISAIQKVRREFRRNRVQTFMDLATDRDTLDLLARKQREEAQSPLEQEGVVSRVKKHVVRLGNKVWKRMNNSRKKWKGTDVEGPPLQSFGDSAFLVFGVFFTMLAVLKVQNAISSADETFAFNGGPLWAGTLCLVFALTPAPVGQPRQIFAAQLWNALVGLIIRQIPSGPHASPTEDFIDWNSNSFGLPLIWKQSLAVALGVAGQAKLGILHPPAAGLSYAFVSNNNLSWATISTLYLLDVIVVVLSVLILNLSEAKQYPLFWFGFEFPNWHLPSRRKSLPLENSVVNNGDDRNV